MSFEIYRIAYAQTNQNMFSTLKDIQSNIKLHLIVFLHPLRTEYFKRTMPIIAWLLLPIRDIYLLKRRRITGIGIPVIELRRSEDRLSIIDKNQFKTPTGSLRKDWLSIKTNPCCCFSLNIKTVSTLSGSSTDRTRKYVVMLSRKKIST